MNVFRGNRNFTRLFLATAASAVGTFIAAFTLILDIDNETGSGQWLAALLIADFLPIVLVGLVLGPLIDRLSRHRLLVISDLVRAIVFAALPYTDDPALIVALAGVNGVATGFFRPAVWAGMPNLVSEDQRPRAISLLSTVENVAWIAGPAVGAVLALTGVTPAYWVNAGTFLVSAVLISQITPSALQSAERVTRGHWRDVRDGFGLVLRSLPLRTVLIAWGLAAIATASVNVSEISLARRVFDAGAFGFAALVMATGVGLVIGSFVASTVLNWIGMTRTYAGSLLLMAVGFGLASQAPSLPVAAGLAGLATIGNGCAIVCNQLLVQRGAPDAMRGRALAMLMSVYYAMLGMGMAGAGWLVDRVGARTVWAIAGAVYLGAATIAWAMAWRIPNDVPVPAAEADGASAQPDAAQDGVLDVAAAASPVVAAAPPPEAKETVARLEDLLAEVAQTREAERRRPAKVLPYVPRKRRRGNDAA